MASSSRPVFELYFLFNLLKRMFMGICDMGAVDLLGLIRPLGWMFAYDNGYGISCSFLWSLEKG